MSLSLLETSEKYKISVTKLRRMEKDGMLTFAPDRRGYLANVLYTLRRGNLLTTQQLCYLLKNPDLISDLGEWARGANTQIYELGNVTQESADGVLAMRLIDHAANGMGAKPLAEYIAGIIPAAGCNYHYIAVRLLLNIPEGMFDLCYKWVNRAIMFARQEAPLLGMSGSVDRKTKFFRRDL